MMKVEIHEGGIRLSSFAFYGGGYLSFIKESTAEKLKRGEIIMANNVENVSKRVIPFSPPDISELEIAEVAEALRSGWITTGSRTKELERRLAEYCHTSKVVCLNSATAAEELNFRICGIGEGDEVIAV